MPEPVGARLAWARRRAGAQARRRANKREERQRYTRRAGGCIPVVCASNATGSRAKLRTRQPRGNKVRTFCARLESANAQTTTTAEYCSHPRWRADAILLGEQGRYTSLRTMQARGARALQDPPFPLVSWRFVRGDCAACGATRRRRTHRGNIMIFLAGLHHTSRPVRPGSTRTSRPHPQRRLSGRRGLWREIVRGRVIAGGSVTTHASSCS